MAKLKSNIFMMYGHAEDSTVPVIDNEEFVRNNADKIVVVAKDEFSALLSYGDNIGNRANDVSLLLNQKRLQGADPKIVADLIRRRFAERNVQSEFDGLTDAQIFDAIKSRHIQSFSELDTYSEYLSAQLGDSIADIARKRAKAIELAKDEDSKEAVTEVTE